MNTITSKSARQRVTRDANRRRQGKIGPTGKSIRHADWIPVHRRFAAELGRACAISAARRK